MNYERNFSLRYCRQDRISNVVTEMFKIELVVLVMYAKGYQK